MSLEGKSPEEMAALAALSDSVMSNAETRLAFQRLLKKANPGLVVPELELEARAGAVIGEQNTRINKLEGELSEDKRQRAANALYDDLRGDRVVTSKNDFGALVTYAVEKGFQTTEAGLRMAAQHRVAEREAAEPTPSTLSQPGVLKPVDADLLKNPVQWGRQTAAKAMDELFKARKAAA